MSYILEALQKSEQARSGTAPLAGGVSAPQAPARAARLRVWAGALLLLALAAGGGWWLGRGTPQVVEGPSMAASPPVTAPTMAEGVEAGDRGLAPVVPVPEQQVTRAAPAAVPAAPVRLRPLPPVPDTASPAMSADPAPIARAPQPPQAGVPAWSELPPDQRSRVTRPRIDVHVHAEDPMRRFVLIELRRYREGDRLPSGARLERIEADGILLEENGIRYRVPRP